MLLGYVSSSCPDSSDASLNVIEESCHDFQPQFSSSPKHLIMEDCPIFSTSAVDSEHESSTCSTDDELFNKSSRTVNEFKTYAENIFSKHNFTDNCKRDVLSMFAHFLPQPNFVPSLYSLQKSCEKESYKLYKNENCSTAKLNLLQQLQSIIQRHIQYFSNDTITLDLNTDGINPPVGSNKHYQLWPIYASVQNLPTILRNKNANIILCSIYFGKGKPNVVQFLQEVIDRIINTHTVTINKNQQVISFSLKIGLIICDSPVRAVLCGHKQYNGYHGCTFCKNPGKYTGNKITYCVGAYPPKTTEDYELCRVTGTFGIKKDACSLKNISLPNDVPIDPMHILFSRIAHNFAELYVDFVTDLNLIDEQFKTFKLPSLVNRQPRTLTCLNEWKAVELKHFLLYFAPILFYVCSHRLYKAVATISNSIRKMYTPLSEADAHSIENALLESQREINDFMGDGALTYSFHVLIHFPMLCRLHGPLSHFSMFGFESANHHLLRLLNSKTKIVEQIAKRRMDKVLLDNLNEKVQHHNTFHLCTHGFGDAIGQCTVRYTNSHGLPLCTETKKSYNNTTVFSSSKKIFFSISHIFQSHSSVFLYGRELITLSILPHSSVSRKVLFSEAYSTHLADEFDVFCVLIQFMNSYYVTDFLHVFEHD